MSPHEALVQIGRPSDTVADYRRESKLRTACRVPLREINQRHKVSESSATTVLQQHHRRIIVAGSPAEGRTFLQSPQGDRSRAERRSAKAQAVPPLVGSSSQKARLGAATPAGERRRVGAGRQPCAPQARRQVKPDDPSRSSTRASTTTPVSPAIAGLAGAGEGFARQGCRQPGKDAPAPPPLPGNEIRARKP